MKKEEAIELLENVIGFIEDNQGRDYDTAFRMAIEALTEPSGDRISREDAFGAVQDHFNADGFKGYDDGQKMMDRIKSLPSAEAIPLRSDCAECALKAINRPKLDEESYERGYTAGQFADRPKGEWIIRENGNKECSLCGHERQDGWDYFCGYCGAIMKGGEQDD